MKNFIFAILFSASFSLSARAADPDQVVKSVTSQVAGDKENVLKVVSKEVAAAPELAGEIVKAAILASHASAELIAAIVEAAAKAAPDQINVIAQSATAVAPDAFKEVQEVVAKLTAFFGTANPLNSPGHNSVAMPLIWVWVPIIIAPQAVTEVNPRL